MSARRTAADRQRSPWFKLWAAEWITDERLAIWPVERKGALLELRCHAWRADPPGTLPDDDESLAVLSRLGRRWPRHAAALRSIMTPADGRLRDDELAAQYASMVEESMKRSASASASARRRWERSATGETPALTTDDDLLREIDELAGFPKPRDPTA